MPITLDSKGSVLPGADRTDPEIIKIRGITQVLQGRALGTLQDGAQSGQEMLPSMLGHACMVWATDYGLLLSHTKTPLHCCGSPKAQQGR